MPRYIDAEDFDNQLFSEGIMGGLARAMNGQRRRKFTIGEFRTMLSRAPTLDVAPVVRCKDCVHLGIKDFAFGYCKKNMCGIVKPDDFCSQGEMREGE